MKLQINAKTICTTALALTLFACSEPRVDASSDDTMKASLEKVRGAVPEERQEKFDEALKVVMFSDFEMKDLFGGGRSPGEMTFDMKRALDGKNAEEIIAAADQVVRERQERERVQAVEEIRELEQKRDDAAVAREDLAAFEILRSEYYLRTDGIYSGDGVIGLTIKNGTKEAVARVYCEGTLASPGRSVPWHKESFNFTVSGGLEPGEERSWSLRAGYDWPKKKAEDAIFTVEVTRIDGADGQALYSTRDFDASDAKRLAVLKEKYRGE